MKIVFMGTPEFAVPSLEKLIECGYEIPMVVTQPDRRGNRGKVTFSPVKECALQHGLPVAQPQQIRKDEEFMQELEALEPDFIVVAAFGQLLPERVLNAPKYDCINVHGSLLPKLRGAAPMQYSILQGDKTTGVTIMQLDEGLDTGDILMVEPVTIGPEETSGELFDRVSAVGAGTLVTALEKIEAGELTPRKQDNAAATMAPPLTKDMAQFDFTQDAAHIHNWVRGMNPWPVAWFAQDGKRIKVLESRLAENPQHAAPGTVLALKPLTIAAENGAVALLTVTPEGGKPMAGTAWAAGRRLKAGDSL